jgi:hypothetical protein
MCLGEERRGEKAPWRLYPVLCLNIRYETRRKTPCFLPVSDEEETRVNLKEVIKVVTLLLLTFVQVGY